MAKVIFIKGSRCALLPFSKLDNVITKIARENPELEPEIDKLVKILMARRSYAKTSTFIPITFSEFNYIKELSEIPF